MDRPEQSKPYRLPHIARASGGSVLLLRVVTTPIDYGPYPSHFSVLMQEKLEANHDAALASTPAGAARPIQALIGLDGSALAEEVLAPVAHLVTALSVPAHGALHLLQVRRMPAVDSRLRYQVFLSSGSVKQAQQAAEAYLKAVADRLLIVRPQRQRAENKHEMHEGGTAGCLGSVE